MPTLEVVCLASSIKMGGRCVAGIDVQGRRWIRPVSDLTHGTLKSWHYTLKDGTAVNVLDLVKIKVSKAVPLPHQPENWLMEKEPWELLSRPAPAAAIQEIMRHVSESPLIFGTSGDRVSCEKLPARTSLVLIRPSNIYWHVTTDIQNRPQARLWFSLKNFEYSLGITDPIWRAKLCSMPVGVYKSSDVGIKEERHILITVSLGEPFHEYCYKLVAAIFVLPINKFY
jgi:hypothetical protein